MFGRSALILPLIAAAHLMQMDGSNSSPSWSTTTKYRSDTDS